LGIGAVQALKGLHRILGIARIPVMGADLRIIAHADLEQDIGNSLVGRMVGLELFIQGLGLAELIHVIIGIGRLQLGQKRHLAEGKPVLDLDKTLQGRAVFPAIEVVHPLHGQGFRGFRPSPGTKTHPVQHGIQGGAAAEPGGGGQQDKSQDTGPKKSTIPL
jgi:hypothetical protein